MNRKNILKTLKVYFKNREEVVVAYLFGSLAIYKSNPLSDIDIAILVNQENILVGFLEYRSSIIADLISILRNNKIDLIVLNNSPPLLAHRVLRDGIVVYNKDDAKRIDFEVKTLKQYIDTQHLRSIQNYYFKKRILG